MSADDHGEQAQAPAPDGRDWTQGTAALLLAECAECGRRRYLPAERCAECGSVAWRRLRACGRGRCVGQTRWHGTGEDTAEPLALVLVELAEGPVVMARAAGGLQPGDAARLLFIDAEGPGGLLPAFAPKGEPA